MSKSLNYSVEFKSVSKIYNLQNQRTLKEMLPVLFKKKISGKKKNKLYAVDNISFQVKQGETVGIIGPNGAGKSTILKLIAGVTQPTSGEVNINGRVSPLIELGAGFHPDLTGKENIYLNGSILGLTKKEIDKKFKKIVDFADLWEFINQPVKNYSSGMYMRLGFSIAINAFYELLLIDEILAVGDFRFQQKCYEKLREAKDKGKTIIFVTHDLSAARAFCDRIIITEKGKIVEQGQPDEMVDKYVHSESGKKDSKKITGTKKQKENNKKEIFIEKVVFKDKNNQRKSTFLSGEKMKVSIKYQSNKDFKDIVFGIAFYKEDGTHLYGTNSLIQERNLKIEKGNGQVSFKINSLPILYGRILVTAAIHSRDHQKYDWQEKKYSFSVFKSKAEGDGLIDFGAKFSE
jgi:ABC-type polysaccharide/polyol phosphate transport system ATPase subunit